MERIAETDQERELWQPVIFGPTADRRELDELIDSGAVWRVHDTLRGQLRDLASSRSPDVDLSSVELDERVEAMLADTPVERYGRWVLYPWSGQLVHVLGPGEYRELRLNRNRYKIRSEEEARLGQLTVGIVGLSVGNAIALTLALEGMFGHLRLADFDRLGLSNMNRVRAGVHEVELRKTILAARQIFEINPYASLSLMHTGVTAENVDRFILGDSELRSKLDVVIDECDSLYVKFLVRERARELKLPVLMETSDRGMLDVERFDLEPDRPLLHGLVGDLSSEEVRALDVDDPKVKEQKAVHVVRLLDGQMLSTRLAASMLEVDSSISSWPQLASDVVLGGASTAVALRRLALGQSLPSGRRYVDLQSTIAIADREVPLPSEDARLPSTLPELGSAHPEKVEDLPELAHYLVQSATLAPSGGNVQPWHFYWGDDRLWVTHDPGRSRNLLDGSFHATYLALGAAVENIVIAAAERGLATDVDAFPRADDATVAAELRFEPVHETERPALADVARLMPLVAERQTNRKLGRRAPLADEDATALVAAASERGGSLELCTDPAGLEEVGKIIGVSDRVRMLCPGTHRELVGELRWTSEEAERTRDGVTLTSLELSPGGEVGVRLMTRPDVAGFLRELNGGKRLEEAAWDSVAAASAVGLLSLDSDSRETWIAGGRAMQRMWLEATALGIAMQPMTVVLYQFEMLAGESASVYTDAEVATLRSLEERLYQVFRRPPGAAALLFRLARVGEAAERSLRLPAQWVLSAGPPRAASREAAT